jgi:hypothetical protein
VLVVAIGVGLEVAIVIAIVMCCCYQILLALARFGVGSTTTIALSLSLSRADSVDASYLPTLFPCRFVFLVRTTLIVLKSCLVTLTQYLHSILIVPALD